MIRNSLLGMAACLLVPLVQTAFPQSCDNCAKPDLVLYDCDVQVDQPSTHDSVLMWENLYMAAHAVRTILVSNDPQKNCITWLDGSMVNANTVQNGTLKFGLFTVNLPPSGPVASGNYLLTGVITQNSAGATLTASVECAISREVVASEAVSFVNDVNGTGAAQAAQDLAAKLMPMLPIIRNFEIKKRDADTSVAIRDNSDPHGNPDISVIPDKVHVNIGDTVHVDFTMIDCDGVPLKDRKISLVEQLVHGETANGPENGAFDSIAVTTDNNGAAKARFIAGTKNGPAILRAHYAYTLPNGADGLLMGDALITINAPPTGYWIARVQADETSSYASDTDWSFQLGSLTTQYENHDRRQIARHMSARIWIKNFNYDSLRPNSDSTLCYSYVSKPPISATVTGGCSNSYSCSDMSYDNGLVETGDVRSDNASCGAWSHGVSFSFCHEAYADTNPARTTICTMDFYASFTGTANNHDKLNNGDGWHTYSESPADTDGEEFFVNQYFPGTSITKTDSGYDVSYTNTDVKTTPSTTTTVKTNVTATLRRAVRPPTSVTPGIAVNRSAQPLFTLLGRNGQNRRLRCVVPYQSMLKISVYAMNGSLIASQVFQQKNPGALVIPLSFRLAAGCHVFKVEVIPEANYGGKSETVFKTIW